MDNWKWVIDNCFMITPHIPSLTFTPLQQPITKEITTLKSRTNFLLPEGHFDRGSKWGGTNCQCI